MFYQTTMEWKLYVNFEWLNFTYSIYEVASVKDKSQEFLEGGVVQQGFAGCHNGSHAGQQLMDGGLELLLEQHAVNAQLVERQIQQQDEEALSRPQLAPVSIVTSQYLTLKQL